MKTSKVELLKWLPSEGENIEIDWPKVHKTIGVDQHCRLVAEFYDSELVTNYHLMWAK